MWLYVIGVIEIIIALWVIFFIRRHYKNLRREPVMHWAANHALYTRYETTNGDVFEVSVYPDPASPATFLVKSNGLIMGRIWVDDNGMSLGISDTVAPMKFTY